jgi:hypothetical protein
MTENTDSSPTILTYPKEIAQDGYNETLQDLYNYGNYIVISIYEPQATKINEELTSSLLTTATIFGVPAAIDKFGDKLGFLGNVGDALSSFTGNITLLQVLSVLASYDNLAGDVKELISGVPPTAGTPLAEALDRATASRVPDSRSSLGLGVLYNAPKHKIILPMPKQLRSNYGFEFTEEDFSAVKLLNATKDVLLDIRDILSSVASGAPMSNNTRLTVDESKALASFLNTIPAGTVDKSLNLLGLNPNLLSFSEASSNRAKIPYMEKVFKSVKRRTFDLEYTFIPRSPEEVHDIYKIIKILKANAHPRKSNGNDYYYITPSEFLIDFEFMGNKNEFLPTYGRLAMENIDVTYGSSDGFSAFRPIDSIQSNGGIMVSPSEINVKMSFSELELLTKERIEEGF